MVVAWGILLLQLEKFTEFLNAKNVDFFHYWSTARLMITGDNPYDIEQLFVLQKTHNPDQILATGTWYPPWTMSIILPFGYLSYSLAHAVGFIGGIVLLISCALVIWSLYSGPRDKFLLPILFAVTFSPLVFSIYEGQINILVLTGLTGFMFFERRGNPFLAGVSVALMTVKPHVLYLFWFALLYWLIKKRSWNFLWGVVLTLGALTGIAVLINQNLLQQYYAVSFNTSPTTIASASINGLYLWLTGETSIYLTFGLIVFGLLLLTSSIFTNQFSVSWKEQLPIILFVSLITAPYIWVHDGLVLLIPLLSMVIAGLQSQANTARKVSLVLYILVNIACYVLIPKLRFEQFLLFWVPGAFLFVYLYASKHFRSSKVVTSYSPAEIYIHPT
jgi:hypothetical protein